MGRKYTVKTLHFKSKQLTQAELNVNSDEAATTEDIIAPASIIHI